MGLRRRTALRAPGPSDREARGRSRGVKGAGRVSEACGLDQGVLQMVGADLCVRPSKRRSIYSGGHIGPPLQSPHFQDAFHALLAVAFEEEQLLVTVDREGARHRRGERDLHGLRSEEHTSELQSQSNLVCRLLLEKKKKQSK